MGWVKICIDKIAVRFCKYCGQFETLKHLIFQCRAYNEERTTLLHKLCAQCDANDFNSILQDHDFALLMFLGDHDNIFNELFLYCIGSVWYSTPILLKVIPRGGGYCGL